MEATSWIATCTARQHGSTVVSVMGRALFLAALLAAALGGASGEMPPRVKFVLRNLCGRPIELYWIMPTPDKHGERGMILQGPEVKNSSAMPIDSFVGHEFVVRPTDSPKPLAGRGGEIVWEGLHVVPEAHFVMSEVCASRVLWSRETTTTLQKPTKQPISSHRSERERAIGGAFSRETRRQQ